MQNTKDLYQWRANQVRHDYRAQILIKITNNMKKYKHYLILLPYLLFALNLITLIAWSLVVINSKSWEFIKEDARGCKFI